MVKLKMVDKFEAIKAMLNGKPAENFSVAEAVKFIDERIEQVNKKNAGGADRKPTKTQVANEGIKADILSALSAVGKPTTIGELCKVSPALAVYSNQKISALLTQLGKSGEVVRTEVKGKAHFALADRG